MPIFSGNFFVFFFMMIIIAYTPHVLVYWNCYLSFCFLNETLHGCVCNFDTLRNYSDNTLHI
jgi:hypothetical protein